MKKLNKFIAILVSLAMMATLCVCMAFAVPNVVGTDKDHQAEAALTKTLQMPEGTNFAQETFTFNFEADKTAGDKDAFDFTKNITFAAVENAAATQEDGSYIYQKNTGSLFDIADFDHTGRYVWNVKEAAGSTDGMDYSKAEYKVTVDVARDADGNLYFKNIAVQEIKDDEGNDPTLEEGATEAKVDPSVPTDGEDENTDPTDGEGNGFNFTNTYIKDKSTTPDGEEDENPSNPTPSDPDAPEDPNPGDQTDDDYGLYVQKDVAGDLADTEMGFTFSVKVKAPALSKKTAYHAIVVDTNATNTKAAVDVDTTATKDADLVLTFNSDTAYDVTLKDGYRLVFTDLEVGAKFEAAETKVDNYNPGVETTGTVNATNTGATGKVTENDSAIAVTNTYDAENTTPTGILISNLPYIALALVAIGGLCAYVIVRRKADDEA